MIVAAIPRRRASAGVRQPKSVSPPCRSPPTTVTCPAGTAGPPPATLSHEGNSRRHSNHSPKSPEHREHPATSPPPDNGHIIPISLFSSKTLIQCSVLTD